MRAEVKKNRTPAVPSILEDSTQGFSTDSNTVKKCVGFLLCFNNYQSIRNFLTKFLEIILDDRTTKSKEEEEYFKKKYYHTAHT